MLFWKKGSGILIGFDSPLTLKGEFGCANRTESGAKYKKGRKFFDPLFMGVVGGLLTLA